jgi:hypothetical protein
MLFQRTAWNLRSEVAERSKLIGAQAFLEFPIFKNSNDGKLGRALCWNEGL